MRRLLFGAPVVGCASAAMAVARSARGAQPNVVTDDLGWADLGGYGATDVRAPPTITGLRATVGAIG
jgi:hypothetical protein